MSDGHRDGVLCLGACQPKACLHDDLLVGRLLEALDGRPIVHGTRLANVLQHLEKLRLTRKLEVHNCDILKQILR